MDDQIQKDFLRKRMIELREKNHKTQSDMAELIGCNKSTLSRAEKIGGDTSYKTVLDLPMITATNWGSHPDRKTSSYAETES